MCDVDHFKRFNDTHGHEAGDLVLVEFGKLLRTCIRREDIACRYGGEEFLVILPDANRDTGLQRAESLCQVVREMNLQYHGQALGSISISIGLAVFAIHGTEPEQLVRAADQALYEAKKAGRDRVHEAEPVPSSGSAAAHH